jgi:ABC-type sugar transport system substrate-binding protein
MRRSRYAIAVIVATALAAAGCSSSGGSKPAASGTSGSSAAATTSAASATKAQAALAPYLKAPTALTVTTPLSARPPTGKTVYFLSDGIPISQQISTGIQGASAVLGWNSKVITWNPSNPASINSAMLTAVNAGADAIVFPATDAAALSGGLAAAAQKGVIVIGDATGNPAGTAGITAEVNSALTAGVTWGKLIGLGIAADAEKAGQTAHVVNVTAPVYATVLKPTDDSEAATLKTYCAQCTFNTLDISAQDLFAGKTPQLVVSYLQSHPDTTAISVRATGLLQPGLTTALKAAGMSKIKVYGDVPLAPQLAELKAGTAAGYAVDPLAVTGWMCVDAIARQLVDKDGAVYTTADTPQWWLTQSTDFDPSAVPLIPLDYEAQFKKMWDIQ